MRAQLLADELELISRLDREIEELSCLAPLGYEQTIAELQATLRAIHDAIDRLTRAERR